MKKNLFLFLMMTMVVAMISCSTDDASETHEKERLEVIHTQLALEMQNSPNRPEINSGRAHDDGGNSICFNANLLLDKDCNGSFETGENELTATYQCCINKVGEMISNAQSKGWCYYNDVINQCQQVTCDGVDACYEETF